MYGDGIEERAQSLTQEQVVSTTATEYDRTDIVRRLQEMVLIGACNGARRELECSAYPIRQTALRWSEVLKPLHELEAKVLVSSGTWWRTGEERMGKRCNEQFVEQLSLASKRTTFVVGPLARGGTSDQSIHNHISRTSIEGQHRPRGGEQSGVANPTDVLQDEFAGEMTEEHLIHTRHQRCSHAAVCDVGQTKVRNRSNSGTLGNHRCTAQLQTAGRVSFQRHIGTTHVRHGLSMRTDAVDQMQWYMCLARHGHCGLGKALAQLHVQLTQHAQCTERAERCPVKENSLQSGPDARWNLCLQRNHSLQRSSCCRMKGDLDQGRIDPVH
mmetsp:Transcript_10817/g.33187  ORF Transcript_10817/g.33187 Transcript_10817/m.33187 type:complete len:328 (+) Transcript_10817:73-1056(+)